VPAIDRAQPPRLAPPLDCGTSSGRFVTVALPALQAFLGHRVFQVIRQRVIWQPSRVVRRPHPRWDEE
jgi:hypothetical protein